MDKLSHIRFVAPGYTDMEKNREIKKLTVEDLEKMNIKALENFLNDSIRDLKTESVDRRDIRREMFSLVKEHFLDDKIYWSHNKTDYSEITMMSKRYSIVLKASTKATGNLQTISKYRKKDIVIPGKFKVSKIYGNYTFPCFELGNLENYSIIINGGSHYASNYVWIDLSDLTFEEMAKPQFFLEQILKKYKKVEETNEHYNTNDYVYKDLREEIILKASQPLIAVFCGGRSKDAEKVLPKKYKEQIRAKEGAWFDICKEVVAEYNADLIEKVYNGILEGKI